MRKLVIVVYQHSSTCSLYPPVILSYCSMKRGRIVSISHDIPEESPFTTYRDLKRHWKNTVNTSSRYMSLLKKSSLLKLLSYILNPLYNV